VARIPWHAYNFNSSDNSSPPAWTTIIEAKDEDEAAKVAAAQMSTYLRVEIARPVWAPVGRTNPIHQSPRKGSVVV
jgi:hypothetical protein